MQPTQSTEVLIAELDDRHSPSIIPVDVCNLTHCPVDQTHCTDPG